MEGTGVSQGITLAVKDINAAGGFKVNVVNYNISLRTIDDASIKDNAATNNHSLIE